MNGTQEGKQNAMIEHLSVLSFLDTPDATETKQ